MSKRGKRKKIEWIWYIGLVFIIIGILVTVAIFGKIGPSERDLEYEIIFNEVTIPAKKVTIDVFNYDSPGKCEAIDAKVEIMVTELNTTGNLSIKINDIWLGGYLEINHTGSYDLGCACECNIESCNCFILGGENRIIFISYGFEGKLKYTVTVPK